MDNAYRFGKVSVSCEGYSYPDDPYILKGSCGVDLFLHNMVYYLSLLNGYINFSFFSLSTQLI